ncbi:hypothetical protein GJAV_G00270050 [Gymnothorax javanicus]|nr:hypothetical protein GJAV_G00270050 [Gymnothorax javanicus]
MGARKTRVNLLVNNAKQLVRSVLLLAHYATAFFGCVASSVNCAATLLRWTALSAQFTLSVFNAAYKHLRWWGRRGGANLQSVRPGKWTLSEEKEDWI